MQNNACTISSGNSWKLFFFGTSSSYAYSYIMICYTGSCCHAPPPKKTQPSIPHYNNYICEVDIQNKTTKSFQNLLTLEGSFSINILSTNTLHLHDGFLVPQNEHDAVSLESKLKVLLPIRNF